MNELLYGNEVAVKNDKRLIQGLLLPEYLKRVSKTGEDPALAVSLPESRTRQVRFDLIDEGYGFVVDGRTGKLWSLAMQHQRFSPIVAAVLPEFVVTRSLYKSRGWTMCTCVFDTHLSGRTFRSRLSKTASVRRGTIQCWVDMVQDIEPKMTKLSIMYRARKALEKLGQS
jgi:hypothetical protein